MDEIWKPVVDFDRYLISSKSNIKKLMPDGSCSAVKIQTTNTGFYLVSLQQNKRKQNISLHKITLETFSCKQPSFRHVVGHSDGDKLNGNIENLYWKERYTRIISPRINNTKEDMEKFFWSHIEKKENGCWIWTGAIEKNKYPVFYVNSVLFKARHYIYSLRGNKKYNERFNIHSYCDNWLCVNPEHFLPKGWIRKTQ